MKLLQAFKDQLSLLGPLKRVWFTSFNINTDFIETYLLPTILKMDAPRNRMDYESFQMELTQKNIDLRIFCDKRVLEPDQYKRTAIAIHPVSVRAFSDFEGKSDESLFHPKVIFLEDTNGKMILGAGSANLTVSGWGRNQEVFSFHVVSSDAQYNDVSRFFSELGRQINLDNTLRVTRRSFGDDLNWRFVHSFQKKTFITQLFDGMDAKRLTVWSPYLSGDVPQLMESIRHASRTPGLKFSVVPDRIEGRYIRTPWSESLSDSLEKGDLSFRAPPGKKPDNIELVHAKIWLASGSHASRLAIGSWNFTHSGASSFKRRNIEAGILIDYEKAPNITGDVIPVSAADFASDEMLVKESLSLPETLPFDLQVTFDWHTGNYQVEGQLFQKDHHQPYSIKLPGFKKSIALSWRTRRNNNDVWPLEPIELNVVDNEALLSDHSYAVELQGVTVYRGLILELGQKYRRAQGYDTLQDLLDGLVNGDDPTTTDKVVLRDVLRNGGGPDEELPLPVVAKSHDTMTYFRLFYAIEQYRLRLRAVQSFEQLEKWLFTYPGCVQELATKVHQQLDAEPGTVFNWFLAQEVNTLYDVALERYEDFRERYVSKQPPQAKWSTLKVKLPKLPAEIAEHKAYLRDVKRECGYGSA